MATDLHNIPSGNITIRYQQPYVSEALNRKSAIVHRGIVRGATLETSASNDTVLLTPDGYTQDTVINMAGHSRGGTNGNYFVTYRTTSPVSLVIPSDGALHFICVVSGYSLGSTTVAVIKDYTEAEYEGGAHETDGGVLIGVVKANSASGLIGTDQVIYVGMTNASRVPFARDNRLTTSGGRTSDDGGEDAVLYSENFDLKMSPERISYHTQGSQISSYNISFAQSASVPYGGTYMRVEKIGTGGSIQVKTNSMFDMTGFEKIRVSMLYKGAYTSTGTPSQPRGVYIEATRISPTGGTDILDGSLAPCFAPTTQGDLTTSSGFQWLTYEIDASSLTGHTMGQVTIQIGEQITIGSAIEVAHIFVTGFRPTLTALTAGEVQGVNPKTSSLKAESSVVSSLTVSSLNELGLNNGLSIISGEIVDNVSASAFIEPVYNVGSPNGVLFFGREVSATSGARANDTGVDRLWSDVTFLAPTGSGTQFRVYHHNVRLFGDNIYHTGTGTVTSGASTISATNAHLTVDEISATTWNFPSTLDLGTVNAAFLNINNATADKSIDFMGGSVTHHAGSKNIGWQGFAFASFISGTNLHPYGSSGVSGNQDNFIRKVSTGTSDVACIDAEGVYMPEPDTVNTQVCLECDLNKLFAGQDVTNAVEITSVTFYVHDADDFKNTASAVTGIFDFSVATRGSLADATISTVDTLSIDASDLVYPALFNSAHTLTLSSTTTLNDIVYIRVVINNPLVSGANSPRFVGAKVNFKAFQYTPE